MPNVTIASDSPEVLSVAAMTLRARGYAVCEALGGMDSLRALQNGHMDLLITDARLPDMTASDLIGHVWRSQPELPVVVMVGYFDEAASSDELGTAALLPKPFLPRDLVAAVERAQRAARRLAA
jgi:DNA-binding NtrC family response regulator